MTATLSIFLFFVAVVLGISFWLGSRAKSAQGYFAAHGQIPWFVNGIAFAGDYLSAASFLGICGMIATAGYDGFLYSIGFLAGWVVALFVVAEPMKRLGRFTFADALDSRFDSRGIKLAAATSALVISIFYLIPQMVGAGSLIGALLGWEHWAGVLIVGTVVILIVATAGMVSTTWVQFIKGSLLVVFCTILTAMILGRGLTTTAPEGTFTGRTLSVAEAAQRPGVREIAAENGWAGTPYVRFSEADGVTSVWRRDGDTLRECQWTTTRAKLQVAANGVAGGALKPVGHVAALGDGRESTGPLSPGGYLDAVHDATVVRWIKDKVPVSDGDAVHTVWYPQATPGSAVLRPGLGLFAGIDSDWYKKLNFISLMLALFCGTASLPHILIRYYTVKDAAGARKSTVVGIAAIGAFYVLTLFIGLGAMTSGTVNLADSNQAAPYLAKGFNEILFAVISAIAFTTILGTVSGLIMAASGAVAHDLMANVIGVKMDDHGKVRAGKVAAIVVGVIAMALGIAFKSLNVSFLVGWAFAIAASANLPSLALLLFWRGTTKQGITWGVVVGMVASLAWVLLSADAYKDVYGLDPARALMPFNQPGIVTIPLGFLTVIVVSLLTRSRMATTRVVP
ncbi:MAG TPA: cation acetate symporter [Planctomycetota bacterium]|nr:cation acetate symporter [Planctomycetota bacterium]